MSCDCFVFTEERDEFRMWQGLVGPYYTPAVDSLGNLSWTNNGNLVNPPTVNVSGRGLTITGIVDTAGDLPASAPQYTCYLVGTTSPYHAYIWDGTTWTDLGIVGKGDKGDPGDDGFSPTVTVSAITGGHQVAITDATGTDTFNVMDGVDGVPSGGTDGQMLVKDGNTDYATKWQNQPTIPTAYTSDPAMDGTASPGSSTAWAKGDHVHPHDTSKADTGLGITGASVGDLVRISAVDANNKPTAFEKVAVNEIKCNDNLLDNWYFGNPVNQRGQSSYIATSKIYTIDRWDATNATVAIQNGLLNVSTSGTSEVRQILDLSYSNLAEKKITVSAIIDGELFEATGTVPSSKPSEFTNIAIITKNNILFRLGFSSASDAFMLQFRVESSGISYSVEAAKLELGSEQTLAHQENGVWVLNEIPDYWTELAKCQRYFVRNVGLRTAGYMLADNKATIQFPTPVPMAATPTATIVNRGNVVSNGAFNRVSTFSVMRMTTSGVEIDVVLENSISNAAFHSCTNADCTFNFSCEP